MGFAIPAGCKNAALNPRITLTVSVDLDNYLKLHYGRWDVAVVVGTTTGNYGMFAEWMLGDPLPEIDITDLVTEGTNVDVYIYVDLLGEISGSHSDCTGHPDCSASATMKFYRRLFAP